MVSIGKNYFIFLLIWILSISLTVFEIFDLKVSRVWPRKWLLTFRGHLIIFLLFESIYETSYLISIDTFYLVPFFRYSTSKFLRFDLDLWHLEVTRGRKYFHYSKAHTWLLIYFLLTLSPRSRTVFEIFDFKVSRVWPWTLTFRGHPRSRIFLLFEIPYMTSYLTSIDTFSLSRIVVEIYSDDLEDFGGWPWP